MDSAPFTPCYLSEMQTIYTLYCTLIKRCFIKPYSNGSFIIMKINLKNHYKLYSAKRQNIDVDWCHSSFLDAEQMQWHHHAKWCWLIVLLTKVLWNDKKRRVSLCKNKIFYLTNKLKKQSNSPYWLISIHLQLMSCENGLHNYKLWIFWYQ